MPNHEPPETVESALVWLSRLWPSSCRYDRARSSPMAAESAREPPPLRQIPTLPGVFGSETNCPTVKPPAVSVSCALKVPDTPACAMGDLLFDGYWWRSRIQQDLRRWTRGRRALTLHRS